MRVICGNDVCLSAPYLRFGQPGGATVDIRRHFLPMRTAIRQGGGKLSRIHATAFAQTGKQAVLRHSTAVRTCRTAGADCICRLTTELAELLLSCATLAFRHFSEAVGHFQQRLRDCAQPLLPGSKTHRSGYSKREIRLRQFPVGIGQRHPLPKSFQQKKHRNGQADSRKLSQKSGHIVIGCAPENAGQRSADNS